MMKRNGAVALAEGNPDFKVEVNLVFNNERVKKDFVLRTTLDQLSVWKAKHSVPASPFRAKHKEVTKEAAFIDNEVWVFGIDATKSTDICAAVQIGMHCYKAKADELLGNIYVKNLNAERENEMEAQGKRPAITG
ncbi:hypothetical protein [Hahella ganghwensis]|uniref:hypothetical protein n=1 Tax=Hahella ganghwensis TaxID=286420 RepID=UPI00039D2C22|nr:hypothetical protein [Hahella ganghwensis]